jgi:hypothetical protein
MTLIEKIHERVLVLPEPRQAQVLDFVEFLLLKGKPELHNHIQEQENLEWSHFSLAMAMRGMEDEEGPEYTLEDLKEIF